MSTATTDHAPARGTLFIVSAPSGAGKTSLVNALVSRHQNLVLSVSHTTRPARPQEINGQHYHFVADEAFDSMVSRSEFLEHARVFDNRYGTARAAVEEELEAGRDVLLEIDWQGAAQVRENMPECCSIFILPPSREELIRRLTHRGQDSQAVIDRRMADAEAEMSHYTEFDYLVINDDFDQAVQDLESILISRRLKLDRQQQRFKVMIEGLLPGN